jgi:hypothetical protein
MSIENSIKRNRDKRNVFENRRIAPYTVEQAKLTEEWIVPYAEAIVADAEDIRKKVDRILSKRSDLKDQLRLRSDVYPVGLCQEIAPEFSRLMEGELLNRDYKGMQAVKNFVRAGGVIQPFWGIAIDMHFHNAIQLGTSVLDVANDTVDKNKSPVVLYPNAAESPFKNIDSVEQFADIIEKYWHADVYPNIYLPWFAPAFPLLLIRRSSHTGKTTDTLMLEPQVSHVMVKNLVTLRDNHLFGLSSDFIFKSRYSEKRLPPDILDALLNEKREEWKKLERKRPDIYRISTDPAEAEASIRRFHLAEDAKEIPQEYKDEMRQINSIGWGLDRYILAQVGR